MNHVTWTLPNDLLAASIEIMRADGAVGNEGLALWLGTGDDDALSITHVVAVRGTGFVTSPLYLRLSFRAIAQLTDLAQRLGVYLVGQVHSHPGLLTDLSDLDREQGFRVPDFLSVVCPHYAQRPATKLEECGIHVFEGRGYRRLGNAESRQRIQIAPVRVARVECEVHHD
jgi:hypothetical protein